MAINALTYSENGEQTFRSRTDKINELVAESNRISQSYANEYYVGATGLSVEGLNPPTWKQFKDSGVSGTDGALQYFGSYSLMDTSGGYAALQSVVNTSGATPAGTGQYTIEFHIKPTKIQSETVINIGSNCDIRLDKVNGGPGFRLDFGKTRTFPAPLQINAWNHVIIVVDNDPAVRSLDVYTNGQRYATDTGTGETTMSTSEIEFGVGSGGTSAAEYIISDLTVYDVMFTEEQVAERYNNGVATVTLPTGVTDANRVMFLEFNEVSGNTITNTKGPNAILNGAEGVNFDWVVGAVGAESSTGVYLPTYSPHLGQAAGVSVPVPENWSLNTQIAGHMHFSVDKVMPAGTTIIMNMEATIAREDENFGNTVVYTGTYTATGTEQPGDHLEVNWDPINVPGTVNHPPAIVATLVRSKSDTFDGDLYFVNFGIKYTAVR